MPEVLDIKPLDIHVEIRMSLSELNLLADFLDQSEFVLDKDNEDSVKIHTYVTKTFFPFLNKLCDDLMGGSII